MSQCATADVRKTAELYIPENGFNDHWSMSHEGCCLLPKDRDATIWDEAETIASRAHPAWHNCDQRARLLHTRNVFQVLGKNLDMPSDMLICCAKPAGRGVQGGTATAYAIAKMYKVKTFNLFVKEELDAVLELHGLTMPRNEEERIRLFDDEV